MTWDLVIKILVVVFVSSFIANLVIANLIEVWKKESR